MSADSLQVHPPISTKSLRKSKERCDGTVDHSVKLTSRSADRDEMFSQLPRTVNPTLTNSRGRGSQTMDPYPRFYENPLKYTRKRSPSPKPQINRIHPRTSPKRKTAPPRMKPSLSSTSIDKENFRPSLVEAKSGPHYAAESISPWPTGSIRSSLSIRSPNKKSGPLTMVFSNSVSTDTKPPRSILISSSAIPPAGERRCEPTGIKYENDTTSDRITSMTKNHRVQETYTARHAQGHKLPLQYRPAIRTPENMVTIQDFDCHRREVHTVVSTLGSRVGALENTIAAALPVVVEARLLWMENAIVRNPAKLGTTRRALCECYGHPRYETYTRRIHTRAYYCGLTPEDLDYLQERLDALGSQSVKQETLLISPFGGANESGDKTMVDAYRRDTKHGTYARRIWRVCYESAYSVDEDWMLPVPTPDNPTLVEKIKGWFQE